MSYLLESEKEYERLESQLEHKNYRLENEIKGLSFKDNEDILDAGCGSGGLIDFLCRHYNFANIHGIDSSRTRVHQVRKRWQNDEKIQISHGDLAELPYDSNSFDKVFCRYIFEHLEKPQKATNEIFRTLKPQGIVYIINVDSIMFDLHTCHDQLNKMLDKIKKLLPLDIHRAKKIPSYLHKSGLKLENWDLQPMIFKGKDLQDELKLIKSRLDFSKKYFMEVFDSEPEMEEFFSLYLNEIQKPENPLYYNKLILKAKKV